MCVSQTHLGYTSLGAIPCTAKTVHDSTFECATLLWEHGRIDSLSWDELIISKSVDQPGLENKQTALWRCGPWTHTNPRNMPIQWSGGSWPMIFLIQEFWCFNFHLGIDLRIATHCKTNGNWKMKLLGTPMLWTARLVQVGGNCRATRCCCRFGHWLFQKNDWREGSLS